MANHVRVRFIPHKIDCDMKPMAFDNIEKLSHNIQEQQETLDIKNTNQLNKEQLSEFLHKKLETISIM